MCFYVDVLVVALVKELKSLQLLSMFDLLIPAEHFSDGNTAYRNLFQVTKNKNYQCILILYNTNMTIINTNTIKFLICICFSFYFIFTKKALNASKKCGTVIKTTGNQCICQISLHTYM